MDRRTICPRLLRTLAFCFVCLAAESAPTFAQQPCAMLPVAISGGDERERSLVCEGAAQAIQELERCGITVVRPIEIRIVGEVRHPRGTVLVGMFDPVRAVALVTDLEHAITLVRDTPYARIPVEDFYRSLAAHETVHAIMEQHYARRHSSRSMHEYAAYALQLRSLPAASRRSFLDAVRASGNIERLILSDIILSFDPYLFAARAHQHLEASPDSCENLRSLLKGPVDFIAEID